MGDVRHGIERDIAMKHIVEYRLDYEHIVQVGIEANTPEEAEELAQELFDAGDLWNNTPEVPLLFDEYEETDGRALIFNVLESGVENYPEPDHSVKAGIRDTAARKAASMVVKAFTDAAELGGQVDMAAIERAYEVAVEGGVTGVGA